MKFFLPARVFLIIFASFFMQHTSIFGMSGHLTLCRTVAEFEAATSTTFGGIAEMFEDIVEDVIDNEGVSKNRWNDFTQFAMNINEEFKQGISQALVFTCENRETLSLIFFKPDPSFNAIHLSGHFTTETESDVIREHFTNIYHHIKYTMFPAISRLITSIPTWALFQIETTKIFGFTQCDYTGNHIDTQNCCVFEWTTENPMTATFTILNAWDVDCTPQSDSDSD